MSANRSAKLKGISLVVIAAATIAGLGATPALAATVTWNGGDGEWYSSNWSGGSAPSIGGTTASADTVSINSGNVTYTPGGDLVNNGVINVASGASFAQTSSIAWMKIGSGSGNTGVLNISGSYNVGGAQRLYLADGGTADVNVTGGTLTANAIYLQGAGTTVDVTGGGTLNAAAFELSGGSITVNNGSIIRPGGAGFVLNAGTHLSLIGASSTLSIDTGELKPTAAGLISVAGGTVNAGLVAFDGAAATLDFSGGRLNLSNGTHFDGVFAAGGDRYIDFTGDTGTIFLGNNATSDNALALINSGRVRIDGAIVTPDAFAISAVAGGVELALVPEPASLTMLGLGAIGMLRRRRV